MGSSPILILDDVFAELDSARRHRLGAMFTDAEQVLITCAVLSDIPEELGDYRLVSVTAGHAEYVQPATDSTVTDSGGSRLDRLRSVRVVAMSNPVHPQNHVSRETFGEFAELSLQSPNPREVDGVGEFYRDRWTPSALLTRVCAWRLRNVAKRP